MGESLIRPAEEPGQTKPRRKSGVFCLRFVEKPSANQKVVQEFTRPRKVFAVEEPLESRPLPLTSADPSPVDVCLVAYLPKTASSEARQRAKTFMGALERSAVDRLATVGRDAETIDWYPGQALLQGSNDRIDDMFSAVTAFAFYEGELRVMESALEPLETQAQSDVTLVHRIRRRDRRHWQRLRETMESLSRMRLSFARLEPQLSGGARTLSSEARDWMSQLVEETEVEDRLEAINDRLEALEELYEGANQRISDYRWYREGHLLEIGIIFILLAECFLMSGDLYWHFHEHAGAKITDRP